MMRLLAVILSAVSWPSLVCRALGGVSPRPKPQLAALAPVATVPAVAAVPVAAARSWRLALALAVPAAILTWWQLPPRRPPGRRPAAASQDARGTAGELRILTLNVESGQAEVELLPGLLASLRVDVLIAQEVSPETVVRLDRAGLPGVLPYGVVDDRPANAGTAIWSRRPLQPAEPLRGLASAAPRAVLTLDGQPVTITAVHLLAPVYRDREWLQELALLASRQGLDGGAELLAGDFNATRDHRPFRRLLAAGYIDCADAAARRRWPAVTWPSGRRRLPVMRLDHVLATRDDFTVLESRTVLVPGTDHRGVFTVVRAS